MGLIVDAQQIDMIRNFRDIDSDIPCPLTPYYLQTILQYAYDEVLRWSNRLPYCLLKCDKIVVLINQGQLHWVLAVIHVKEMRVEFLDSMGEKDKGSQVRTMMDNDRYQKSRTTHQP